MKHNALIEGAMTLSQANIEDYNLALRYLAGEQLEGSEENRVDLYLSPVDVKVGPKENLSWRTAKLVWEQSEQGTV